jgi:flagellar M-ring protein FliF
MQTLKSFLDQSLLIWKDSTAAARFGLAILLVICIGGITGVGVWSTQPNYVILASDLAPEQAGKAIDALDTAGIAYQVKGTGSIILVDSRNLPRAQIETANLGIRSNAPTLETHNAWENPVNQANKSRRNLEKQLEQSLHRFPAISTAKVHLSIPKKQHFIRHSTAPSAAVVLEVSLNADFGESQATSVAKIVASAVPGLSVERVSITDTMGNLYATDETMGQLTKQEEFRIMRDRELAQKAESMLSAFLDYGNARVEVNTDFTFTVGTSTSIELDPEKVLTNETIKNITETAAPMRPIGAAGTGTNVGNAASSSSKSSVTSKTEDLSSEYETSKIERQESSSTPTLNRLTVAVAVNLAAIKEDTPEQRAKIQETVKSAVGFQEARDQISVQFVNFVVPPEIEPEAFAMPWDQINELVKNISLGIAAIIAFFVARKAFKKMQPDPSAAPELSDRGSQVNQLSDLVKQNPEVFSKIIESWSNVDSNNKADDVQQKRAA